METRTRYFVTDLVDEVGSLPSLAAQVVSLTSDPDCDLAALTKLILSDNVLSLRFLALANSAAVARGQEVRDLRGALVRLGIRRVRNVALLMGMHDMVPRARTDLPLDLTGHWQHGLAVACCAEGLARRRGDTSADGPAPDDAWLVGILHGLGITALTQRTGAEYASVLELARRKRLPLAQAELALLDFHHGELAARILREWNLPRLFCDAVEFYAEDFAADELAPATARLIAVLRSAIGLARAIGYGVCGDGDPVRPLADLASDLGLDPPALTELAAHVDREVQAMSDLIGLGLADNLFAEALQASRQAVAQAGLEGLDDALIKEELEAQLLAARQIQRHLLPADVPQIPGFAVAAVNEPSKAVSGDTYDFITMGNGAFGLLIADVAGKGIAAALLASTLQSSLRALALIHDDPGELLVAANRALFGSTDAERFATLFLAVLDPAAGRLRYAGAGHNPPLLQRADGPHEWLAPTGPPLGMWPESTYTVGTVTLDPDDLLIMYTDGITEATDPEGRELGADGLQRIANPLPPPAPAVVCERILAGVAQHTAPHSASVTGARTAASPTDDLTLVVLKRV